MSKETIKCTDDNIKDIVKQQIESLGNEADLNHLDVSEVTDMSTYNGGMFKDSQFNGDISKWDVSSVTDMGGMFNESQFNGDISKWDVSNVENMRSMFSQVDEHSDVCSFGSGYKFDGDISKWDVSNVTDMFSMFKDSKFNGDISKWDVSNVTDMGFMFMASKISGDISSWDVSNVEGMNSMFWGTEFNGDISKWDVSNLTSWGRMFACSKFNGDISKWDVSKTREACGTGVFYDCPMSAEKMPPGVSRSRLDKKAKFKEKCTDDNIKQVVVQQIELLGNEADLNHLDVSEVTTMRLMFGGGMYQM